MKPDDISVFLYIGRVDCASDKEAEQTIAALKGMERSDGSPMICKAGLCGGPMVVEFELVPRDCRDYSYYEEEIGARLLEQKL